MLFSLLVMRGRVHDLHRELLYFSRKLMLPPQPIEGGIAGDQVKPGQQRPCGIIAFPIPPELRQGDRKDVLPVLMAQVGAEQMEEPPRYERSQYLQNLRKRMGVSLGKALGDFLYRRDVGSSV
jgi:hypothetical protein